MNLLVDTHVLLWWLADSAELGDKARTAIASQENLVYVSAVTGWEISIKKALGKLKVPSAIVELVREGDFLALPITFEHGYAAGRLPRHHHDPFDRMLVAQARTEGMVLVTADRELGRYKVDIMGAR